MPAKKKKQFKPTVRPLVLLSLKFGISATPILKIAREWEWDLLDLELTDGVLPENRPIAGAIIGCLPDEPLAKRLLKLNIPTVRIGRLPHPDDHLIPAVLPDKGALGRMAVDHFVDRDFKHIAYVGHDPLGDSQAVYECFKSRAKERGIKDVRLFQISKLPPGLDYKKKGVRYEWQSHEIGEWLLDLPKPVAVMTYNDGRAVKLCMICDAVGLSVPDDVAVMGVGNVSRFCEMSAVPLTSIDPDKDEQSRQAILLLRQLIEGEEHLQSPIFIKPSKLCARRSTDILAVNDPMVARAIRFMWDHYDQDITVRLVADMADTAPRTLQRAFHREFGKGIIDVLREKRLKEMSHLLTVSDIPIIDLAPKVGFRSLSYMNRAFRAAYHMPPPGVPGNTSIR
jgi:LacI family transcriptional regulator